MKRLGHPATVVLMLMAISGVSLADPPAASRRADTEALEALHHRLIEALELTEAQQRKLESILVQLDDPSARPERPEAAKPTRPVPHPTGLEVTADPEAEVQIEIDGEQLAEALEVYVEQFAEKIEVQAEELEAKLEAFGERMEDWAEEFSEGWEEWAATHESEWEAWSEKFTAHWEQWSRKLQQQHIEQHQVQEVIRGNLELFSQMPLPDLYDQLVASLRRIEDVPWDDLEGIESSVRKAIVQSQQAMSEMARESTVEQIDLAQKATEAAATAQGRAAEVQAAAEQRVKNIEAMLRRMSDSAGGSADAVVSQLTDESADEAAVASLRDEIQALRREINELREQLKRSTSDD